MADIDLPVFSFLANRREPITERLSFLTDVLTSSTGAEQRRSIRPTPRRSFEADFLLTGAARTYFDLFMNKAGGRDMTVPIYWEIVSTPAALTATVSDSVDFDTEFREWEYHTGYLALLTRGDPRVWEIVEIESVSPTGVVFTGPVTKSWPKGSKLLPLRRAAIEQASELRHLTGGVATATVQFAINGPANWTPAADTAPVYAGLPVFLSEPNWVEDLTTDYSRAQFNLDTGVGLTYQTDPLGRALVGQAHRWFLDGREALAEFKDLLYRHRGRAGAFWLPSFKHDLTLAAATSSSDMTIRVADVGLVYTDAPTSGREFIAIKHSAGTTLRQIDSVADGPGAGEEQITLNATIGLDLSPGLAPRISFADTARFDSDEFEIVHHGGIDGLHTSSAVFRTFPNTRTSPTPIHDPIPAATMGTEPCGTYPWYARFRVDFFDGSGFPEYSVTPLTAGANISGSATGADPDTQDHAISDPNNFFEVVWVEGDVPTGQEVQVIMQFAGGAVSDEMRARASFKKFGEDENYRIVVPKAGSWSTADIENKFTMRGRFITYWTFDI